MHVIALGLFFPEATYVAHPALLTWHWTHRFGCRASQLPLAIGGTAATAPGAEFFAGPGWSPTNPMTVPARSLFKALTLSNASALAIGGEQTAGYLLLTAVGGTSSAPNTPRAPHNALARGSVSASGLPVDAELQAGCCRRRSAGCHTCLGSRPSSFANCAAVGCHASQSARLMCYATGFDNGASTAVASCEQFNYVSFVWTSAPSLSIGPRANFNGVRLNSGRLLIAGATSASPMPSTNPHGAHESMHNTM